MAVGCMCVPGVGALILVSETVRDLREMWLLQVDFVSLSEAVNGGVVVDICGLLRYSRHNCTWWLCTLLLSLDRSTQFVWLPMAR